MNDPSLDRALDQALDHVIDHVLDHVIEQERDHVRDQASAPPVGDGIGLTAMPTNLDPALAPLVEAARELHAWPTPALHPSDRAALWTAIRSRVPTSAPPPHPPASAARPLAPWVGACVLAIGALAALLAARGGPAVEVGVRPAVPARTVPAEATVIGRRAAVALRRTPGPPLATSLATSPATSPSTSPVRRTAVEGRATAIVMARPSTIASLPAAGPPFVAPPAPAVVPAGDAHASKDAAGGHRPPDDDVRRDRSAGTARPTVTPGPVLPAQPVRAPERRASPPPSAHPPTMPAAASATGIAGVIRNPDGLPIPRAVVRAAPEDDDTRFVIAAADDAGAYHLDLPAGRWLVSAVAAGHAPRWWPHGATAGEAVPIEVFDGRVTGGIDFVLPLYSGP